MPFNLVTHAGTPAYTTGYDGQCLQQNSGALKNDAITFPSDGTVHKVSLMVRTTSNNVGRRVCIKAGVLDMYVGAAFEAGYNTGSGMQYFSAPGAVDDGNWHECSIEFGPSGMVLRRNGNAWPPGSGEKTAPYVNNSSSDFIVGSNVAGTLALNVDIDDVKYYRDGTLYAHWKLDGNGNDEGGTALPPAINSDLSVEIVPGDAFSYQITASNTPTAFSASGLPSELSINTATGEITGTIPDSYNVTIGASNAGGSDSETLTITVAGGSGGGGGINGSGILGMM